MQRKRHVGHKKRKNCFILVRTLSLSNSMFIMLVTYLFDGLREST